MAQLRRFVFPKDERPPYLRVVEMIREMVAAGTLAVGDTLPKLEELGGHLNLGKNTVSRAYVTLQNDGIIERHSTGHHVADTGQVNRLKRAHEKRVRSDLVDAFRRAKVSGYTRADCEDILAEVFVESTDQE